MIKQGLYLPEFEHENCGAGFICNLKGEKTNQIIIGEIGTPWWREF
jgi:glutamate synthase (ferredoxin)